MSKNPSHDEIAVRAYELFLDRGGEHGRDQEDWFTAQNELENRTEEVEAVYTQDEPEIEIDRAAYATASSGRRR